MLFKIEFSESFKFLKKINIKKSSIMNDNRFLRKIMVLNSDYQPLSLLPLSTVSWQEAIKMVVANDARIEDKIDDLYIRSEKIKFNFPAVIILNRYIKNRHKIKLSRSNIFARDGYTCCFCKKFLFYEREKLTIDHIIPKSKGGKSVWENLVSSCIECNNKKGNKIIYPEKKPKKPTFQELLEQITQMPIYIDHYSWKKYLYYWPENHIILKKFNNCQQ